jgi:nicotinamide mononucleotide (NMN) deamidase PncC
MAAARAGQPTLHHRMLFAGDRAAVRQATVREAFAMLRTLAG